MVICWMETYNTQTTAGLVPFTELMMRRTCCFKLRATEKKDTGLALVASQTGEEKFNGDLPQVQRFKMLVQ